jgi:hypothetical protein
MLAGLKTKKSFISVTSEDLLHTLSKPDGHPNLQSLAAYSNQHVLLRYQLFRAWEALSTPPELRHQLSASERRVRWQLFRIYRARNLVIHHGIDVLHATSLLDTLHYYFSVVLMRIMQTLTTNPKLRPRGSDCQLATRVTLYS